MHPPTTDEPAKPLFARTQYCYPKIPMSETILQAMPQQEIPKRKPQSHKNTKKQAEPNFCPPKTAGTNSNPDSLCCNHIKIWQICCNLKNNRYDCSDKCSESRFRKILRLFDSFLSAALQKLFFDTNNRRRINKYITVLTPPAAIGENRINISVIYASPNNG